MKHDIAAHASTFFENLSSAVRAGETVNIGGGEFSADELRAALEYVHDLRSTLLDAQGWIAKGAAEGAYEKCVAPHGADSTFNRIHALVSTYCFPARP